MLLHANDKERRSLGVLLNPLFGFSPESRPVYWRVLAAHWNALSAVVSSVPTSPFTPELLQIVRDA